MTAQDELSNLMLLPEPDARALLSELGVQLTRHEFATSAEEAANAADMIMYPVAVKIVAENLVHKSDIGGVKLDLCSRDEVKAAFDEICSNVSAARPDAAIRGVLVEAMAPDGLELIVGVVNDPQFGPVLMVGLGGVLVELYNDVSFRSIPVSASEARAMLTELRAYPLLAGYRGGQPGDVDGLVDLMLRIGGANGLALSRHDVAELDLNPVFLYSRGYRVADAKIVVRRGSASPPPVQTGIPTGLAAAAVREKFQSVFFPKAIAVVGTSTDPLQLGNRNVRALADFGFRGPIFPINPRAPEIDGRKAYASVADIPEPVDRAIIAVPPAAVADVIRECGAKGIRAAQVLTAGFREAGAAGQELENQLAQAAREANVRIVGPNSIGTYCPNGRIVMSQGSPVESGSIAFVSQSGGLGRDVIHRGAVRGLRFSKVVSAGNCCDLDVPDYLEFLAIDPDTRIIGLYVEGVRDGHRLLDLIRSTTPTKPVVVLKGGQTELGTRAAASHTGALASDFTVWQSVLRQCGAILADDLEDLIDILVGLALTPLPTGRKVSLIGNGGGATVTASDAFDRVRLWMPDFDEITQQRLAALNLPPGTSLKNPVDAPIGTLRLNEGQVLQEILGIILEDTQIDSIVVHLNLLAILDLAPYEIASQYLQRMVGAVTTVGQRQKPLLLSLRSTGEDVQEQACRAESIKAVAAGVPVYPDIPAAARVLSKLASYREYLGRVGNS